VNHSRLKTITIAALLLINILFAAVIISDTAADARGERLLIEDLCEIVRANGIEISPENFNTSGSLRAMRTSRDDEFEAQIAHSVLGATVMTDQGMIYLYESEERGTAEFSSGGDFDIRLNENIITSSGGTLRSVRRLLRDMNIETAEISQVVSHDSETIIAIVAYRGSNIFNSTIEFTWIGNSLDTIRGRYVAVIETVEDGTEISSVGTALLGFLAKAREGDISCTQILSVDAGYQHRVSGAFGEGIISPVWMITTDTGRYIVDDTGEVYTLA